MTKYQSGTVVVVVVVAEVVRLSCLQISSILYHKWLV